MKGKFRILGRSVSGAFLVCALMLAVIPALPVAAATAVTNVWVQFTQSTYNLTNTASDFTIHFTPTTAMSRGVDTITVWFPDGTTAMGPDNFSLASAVTTASYYDVDRDGEASTYSAVDCTSAAVLSTTGYRITVTSPVDLDAGTACSLRIEADAVVACADETSNLAYKVKVITSQDTTPVLSDAFYIDATGPVTPTLTLSPTTAGSAGQYSFEFSLASRNALTAGEDTVTVIFPYGTTVPSSIDAGAVSWSNDNAASWSTGTVAPTINQKARTVTVTTPITIAAASDKWVKFTTAASIVNPTTVKNDAREDCYLFTSKDQLQVAEADGYNVTAGAATKIGFNNDAYPATSYSDDASMINMYSSRLFVEVQDAYGNAKNPTTEPTVSFVSSQGSGIFYTNAETDGSGAFTQISSSATDAGKLTVYYRDTTAGTVTLTASATSYTSGTWAMTIAPGVSLYDGNNNLIKTYAATSTAAVAETGDSDPETQKYSVDYINDAITAAVAGDTVKLGDGIYELDTYINLNKKVTLTSVNGASSTTIRNTAEIDKALQVGTTGTSTNPIIIDGFTFQRLRSTVDIDCAIRNTQGDYVTVQNCIFNNIIPDQGTAVEAVIWFQAGSVAITSCTISNNTFSNCCGFNAISGGRTGNIVFDNGGSSYDMTGVTVSGNTLTDCNDYGVAMGAGSHTNTATISNNTITNGYSSIALADKTTNCSITGNTITGAYNYGILVEGTTNTGVTIKNNIITGGAGYGVKTSEDGAVVTIQYNDIYSNNSYAIQSTASNQDCKYNWYGSATGPAYTALSGASISKSNPNGTGNKISDYVTYYPWLHKSKVDVVNDNVSYQTSNMQLAAGWNTLSTPVKLISTADSVDELIPAGMTIGYYYDSGWQQITTGKVLNPCDAVYVKMGAVKYVQFKFDAGAFSAPSKDLAAGWNLVGLAYLSSSGKHADDAVASVAKTAANLPGYSQVVSPSINPTQKDMYGNTGTSWAVAYGQTSVTDVMYAGLGYWVYMQNAATLAGFEITPIAPDLD
ncbi:MAG TPA: right-handed parallel beta-helix repeat-containing protein [Dehalococcoidales bacterium]|nr:right-handed parallel beta-helix repeat-containing protein [Dehalococcoidales bacterium]